MSRVFYISLLVQQIGLQISNWIYTLWISRCIATARERIPGSIANYVTGVSERSQQRGNLKDNGYNHRLSGGYSFLLGD